VVVTFESVDEILLCDHSNETSLALLSHSTTYFSAFYKIKLGNLSYFDFGHHFWQPRVNVCEASKREWQVRLSVFSFHCEICRFHNQVRLLYNPHLHVTPKPK